jgi:hypothetical protein
MKKTTKITKKQVKRLADAKRDFKKIQEEIAPFIKRRAFRVNLTAGKWRQTSSHLGG